MVGQKLGWALIWKKKFLFQNFIRSGQTQFKFMINTYFLKIGPTLTQNQSKSEWNVYTSLFPFCIWWHLQTTFLWLVRPNLLPFFVFKARLLVWLWFGKSRYEPCQFRIHPSWFLNDDKKLFFTHSSKLMIVKVFHLHKSPEFSSLHSYSACIV